MDYNFKSAFLHGYIVYLWFKLIAQLSKHMRDINKLVNAAGRYKYIELQSVTLQGHICLFSKPHNKVCELLYMVLFFTYSQQAQCVVSVDTQFIYVLPKIAVFGLVTFDGLATKCSHNIILNVYR